MAPLTERQSHRRRFSLHEREDRLAWIFGSSRSGSSWLLRMLAELEEVVPVDDPHLGHHLGVWRPIPLAWAAAEEPPQLTTLPELKRDKPSYFFSDRYRDRWEPALRELILSRFAAQAAELGPQRPGVEPLVLVKEPGSHVADLLLRLFPGSGLVFLLRDGRDVVDSWVAAYRRGSWAVEEGAFPASPEGRLALVRWQASVWTYRTETVQRAYRRHPTTRKVLVRYERLRADPASELERICAALGIAADAERLTEIARMHDFDRVPEAEKGSHSAIRQARSGGWRETLTSSEQEAMLEVMGPKLTELGYMRPGEGLIAEAV
jgi:LPS sulfotransferase NodH